MTAVNKNLMSLTSSSRKTIAMLPDEHDSYLATELENTSILNTDIPTKQTIGELQLGLMNPQPPYAVGHDAIPLLIGSW